MGNTTKTTVGAFLTAPRYGAVSSLHHIHSALAACRIPLNVSGGVYYGQCMQHMLLSAAVDGPEYLLAIDYDSLFMPHHVHRLLGMMIARPEIDALAAMQARRNCLCPLFTMANAEGELQDRAVITDQPVPCHTAHFGLTVIRASSLRDLPLPWFVGKPNDEGHWGDGKIDEDIWFWVNWRKHGRSVYIDPGCNIGHLEEVVSVMVERDGMLEKQIVTLSEWKELHASPAIETVERLQVGRDAHATEGRGEGIDSEANCCGGAKCA